jgi:hypothetical protein
MAYLKTLEARFWQKVDKNGPTIYTDLGPCWLWIGGHHPLGYGLIWDGNKVVRASHVAIYLETKEWPVQDVLHECDNPPCIRFSHLKQGTHKQNMQDAVRRGLLINPKGEFAAKAKLTQQQVDLIRNEYIEHKITHRALAKKYNVCHSTIGCILRRSSWR